MNDINELFFELIRVAIGTQEMLSRAPSAQEWKVLYDMAKKQSLVGVCFAGVQRLSHENQNENENHLEPCDILQTRWNLPEMLYLTWMGMAAKVQQRNEIVSRQCVELCNALEEAHFRTCILKGQGTAALYWVSRDARLAADARLEVSENPSPSTLTTNPSTLTYIGALRQSGDIDVWVMPEGTRTINASRALVTEMVYRRFPEEKGAFVHIGYPCFSDTEVELHYVPTMDGNPWVDRRFRRLFEERQDECFMKKNALGFAVPGAMVNVLFNLHHIKRHFITSGVGLRHVIDFYFILRSMNENENENLFIWIKKLGMEKFFAGVVWVMQYVLFNENGNGNKNGNFGVKPDARLGRFILQEIMQGGNFGHHDERLKGVNEMGFRDRWMHYVSVSKVRAKYFPTEVLWSYVFRLRIGIWRKTGFEI